MYAFFKCDFVNFFIIDLLEIIVQLIQDYFWSLTVICVPNQ